MTYRDLEIYFTTDFYKEARSLCDYYRDGYIIDEEAGKIHLKVGYYETDSEDYEELEACYIFIDNQITENEYYIERETITL